MQEGEKISGVHGLHPEEYYALLRLFSVVGATGSLHASSCLARSTQVLAEGGTVIPNDYERITAPDPQKILGSSYFPC